MNTDYIRSSRLRTVLQQASKVKSYEELVLFSMGRFSVTRSTAIDYADTVIEFVKRQQNV